APRVPLNAGRRVPMVDDIGTGVAHGREAMRARHDDHAQVLARVIALHRGYQ
ncbi:hypothetical protein KIPB_011882, partial [Kipferlia bialata]